MIRGTLTLLSRSIREDALQRRAHLTRLLSVIFLLAFLIAAAWTPAKVGAPGLVFFRSMSYLAIGLISLAGMGHFASAIAEEKEEGTLGLLLLADISPLAILLGKSTNRILSAWLVFVAQFPFALLALILGGLTVGQIFAAYLALAAYLFLIANLALLMSVLSKRIREATAAMTIVTILLLGFVPWLEFATQYFVFSGRVDGQGAFAKSVAGLASLYRDTSVIQQVQRIFDPGIPLEIWSHHITASLGGGVLCFFLAWVAFRRIVWAPDASEPPRGVVPEGVERKYHLVMRAWKDALPWKDYHFLGGGITVAAIKLVLIPFYIFLCLRYEGWIRDATMVGVWEFLRHSFLLFLLAEWLFYSSQIFHVEKRWGTLPTLLMLPHSPLKVMWGKLAGCLLASFPTMVAAISFCFIHENDETWHGVLINWPMLWGVCTAVILCLLTIDCSLAVKWGALPLAMGVLLITGFVAAPFLLATTHLAQIGNPNDPVSEIGPVLYITGVLCVGLQFDIVRRIKQIAGE
ncbi:MAG: ABC transporter permease [Planctomycetaceae bacterium]|nr:ABC transporter permease [Planctomycetaceae bacterium]